MVPTPDGSQPAISVVEVEVPRELAGARFAGITAIVCGFMDYLSVEAAVGYFYDFAERAV